MYFRVEVFCNLNYSINRHSTTNLGPLSRRLLSRQFHRGHTSLLVFQQESQQSTVSDVHRLDVNLLTSFDASNFD